MKKLLLLFLLASTALVRAQLPWDCLQAGNRTFFTNKYGYVRGIKIDSVTSVGSSRIFWPYRSPRGKWGAPTSTNGIVPLDTMGGSWVGRRVESRSNGMWAFDTRFKDTVFINASAGVGVSWRFYDDTSNRYFIATVVAKNQVTVGGVADSVKQISIRAFLTGGVPVADTVDGLQILLSKQHGFVVVPDLHSFPYSNGAPSRNAIAYKSDYYTELIASDYDFGEAPGLRKSVITFVRSDFRYPQHTKIYPGLPGSVYHYKLTGISEHYYNSYSAREIDSIGSNGLVYCHRWTDISAQTPYVQHDSSTRSSLLPHAIDFDTARLPETVRARIWHYYPASRADLVPDFPFKYASDWNRIIGIQGFMTGPFYVNDFEPCSQAQRQCLADTFGTVLEGNCWDPTGGYNTVQLVYARIGSQSFGTPLAIEHEDSKQDGLSWYLTPGSQTLVVSFGSGGVKRDLALTDLSGKVLLTGATRTTSAELPVGQLPRGLYVLAIQGRHGVRQCSKVVLP